MKTSILSLIVPSSTYNKCQNKGLDIEVPIRRALSFEIFFDKEFTRCQ